MLSKATKALIDERTISKAQRDLLQGLVDGKTLVLHKLAAKATIGTTIPPTEEAESVNLNTFRAMLEKGFIFVTTSDREYAHYGITQAGRYALAQRYRAEVS